MDVQELRKEFTQLGEKVYGRPLVYLDNAATSLRPRAVSSGNGSNSRRDTAPTSTGRCTIYLP